MSTQEEQKMAEIKPKIMTGFIHYGEQDELTKLFDILNEFRKNNGLKYSHQYKANMVFFSLSSEHLDEFSKVRPFKISRFQTRSEYKCDQETCDKLMAQKDSFVRMLWDENTGVLTFLSRTPLRVHTNLLKRIFKDSNVEFQKDSYTTLRNFNSGADDEDEEKEQAELTPEGFQRVEKKTRKPKVVKENSKPKVRGAKTTKAPTATA